MKVWTLAPCTKAAYAMYVLVSVGLIAGPLLLVEIGILTWVRHNVGIGLLGLLGWAFLALGTVRRLRGMGLSRRLAFLVLVPYGLNLVFVAYLLLSARKPSSRPPPSWPWR